MIPPILGFETHLIAPAIVLGIVAAGLYGLLAVPLVLTYRVSRTIGFVQGGIALFSMFLYWWLIGSGVEFASPGRTGRIPGTLIVMVVGAVLGIVYGWTVTGKLANWPRLRLTTYSLGWLLSLAGLSIVLFLKPGSGFQSSLGITLHLPSVFGRETVEMVGVVITVHQIVTVGLLIALMLGLSFVLLRTRTGIFIRAIADDPDASRWVGIPLNWVGTGVYGCSGALSALAGVLMTTTIGLDFFLAIIVFLRALTVSILGGFTSLPLALAGCLVLGIAEMMFQTEFGHLSTGQREIILMSVLFGLIFVINRFRPIRVIEAAAQ